MSNFIALALLAILILIPTVAVLRAYRDEFEPIRDAIRKVLTVNPRQPSAAYSAAKDHPSGG